MERGAEITSQKERWVWALVLFLYMYVCVSGSWTPLNRAHFEEKEGI